MRLTEAQKTQVLDAALRWVTEPKLVRTAEGWSVVGKHDEDSSLWRGMEVARVDPGKVWWTNLRTERRRKDIVQAFRGEEV